MNKQNLPSNLVQFLPYKDIRPDKDMSWKCGTFSSKPSASTGSKESYHEPIDKYHLLSHIEAHVNNIWYMCALPNVISFLSGITLFCLLQLKRVGCILVKSTVILLQDQFLPSATFCSKICEST